MTREQTDPLLPPGLLSRCSSCARMLLLCPRSLRDPPAVDILGYYHSPQPLFSPNSPTRRALLHLVPNPLFVFGSQTSVSKRLPAISRLRELRVPSPRHLLSPDSLFLIKHSISLHTGAPNCGRPPPTNPHAHLEPAGLPSIFLSQVSAHHTPGQLIFLNYLRDTRAHGIPHSELMSAACVFD